MTSSSSCVDSRSITNLLKPLDRSELKIVKRAENYLHYFDAKKDRELTENERMEKSMDVSNNYYDLATDFYEYGWGESFHFAVLRPGESRDHSLAKHEYTLAMKLEMKPSDYVLDVGCGIGGPARHLAVFSEARIVGLNCNDYQLNRAKELTTKANLQQNCSFKKGDFNNMPFEDDTFDKAYAIEATCHSDDLSKVYGEIFRVLKPGGLFAVYEWVLTNRYDPENAYHRKLKDDIMEGSGLANVFTMLDAREAMKKSGFELIESRDRALTSSTPWYSLLLPSWTLSGIKGTPLGRWLTHLMLVVMETLMLAPRGSVTVHKTLCKGADGLSAAGIKGIFTPMYLLVGRKPTSITNNNE